MPEPTAPAFPVDDTTLNLLEDSLRGAYRVEDDGQHHWVGSEFPLHRLLEFLSGYDPALSVADEYDPDVHHYTGHLFSTWDVLLALLAEVRQLRASA